MTPLISSLPVPVHSSVKDCSVERTAYSVKNGSYLLCAHLWSLMDVLLACHLIWSVQDSLLLLWTLCDGVKVTGGTSFNTKTKSVPFTVWRRTFSLLTGRSRGFLPFSPFASQVLWLLKPLRHSGGCRECGSGHFGVRQPILCGNVCKKLLDIFIFFFFYCTVFHGGRGAPPC